MEKHDDAVDALVDFILDLIGAGATRGRCSASDHTFNFGYVAFAEKHPPRSSIL
jgi:hypothetical protein